MNNYLHFESLLLEGDIVTMRLWDLIGGMRRDVYVNFMNRQAAPVILDFFQKYGDIKRHLDLDDEGFLIISAWENDRVDKIKRCTITRRASNIFTY